MASFSRKSGIVGALVIAGVLMVGAYVISGPNLSFFTPTANAESTQQLLQEYAQKLDSNGVPEWMAALGDMTPKFTASSTASSTDDSSDLAGTPAAPGTLTDQFAQQFFGQYLQEQAANTSGTQESESDIETFAQNAMQTFVANQTQQDPYTISELKVSGSGATALKKYAADEYDVFAANTVNSDKNEIDYFSDAVEKNDMSALTALAAIGKAYSADAPQLMQISVPSEMQFANLELANATYRLGTDITDMSMMQSDPMRAYIGLSQYQTDIVSFAKAFGDIHAVFASEQVTLSPSDPGYDLYQATSMSGGTTSQ
jgi:hypothetical protein